MEEALMNERIAKLKAEQEGQSAEFIKGYDDRIRQYSDEIRKQELNNIQEIQKLNSDSKVNNEQALQSLLSSFSTQTKQDLIERNFDEVESAKRGYFIDKE
jgi:vacuolar-type H+-ATPase subunit H